VRDAAAEVGIPPIDDFNCGDNEGSCAFHVNQKRGRRWSAARGFLKPALSRNNIKLETGVLAERVLFDGKRAIGIKYRQNGVEKTAKARREVILSSGAVGSPQLLMLSGVGPAAHLQEHGIPVVLDKPGVGGNLQDHLQIRTMYKVTGVPTLNERYRSPFRRAAMGLEYALLRTGPLSMAPSQFGFFTRSDEKRDRANIQFHVQPLSLDKFGDPLHTFPAFTMSVCNLQPASRGTIRLKSSDASAAPAISPNYLSADADKQVAVDSIRVARKVARAPALAKFHPEEFMPGPKVRDDDDAALLKAAGDIGTTIIQPVCACRMGSENGAVV
jgi:choline dehydrogenase-like flavoprotein